MKKLLLFLSLIAAQNSVANLDEKLLNAATLSDADLLVRELINQGANVNARDENTGATPLINAAFFQINRGADDVIKTLVEAGADIKAQNKVGFTAKDYLASNDSRLLKNPEIRKMLGITEADLKQFELNKKLLSAKNSAETETALKLGANVNSTNGSGLTPLMLAVDTNMLKALIKAGAHLNAQVNGRGGTALHIAATDGNLGNVQELLKAKADPNIQDGNGQTALIRAAEEGNKNVILALLKAGANTQLVDDFHSTFKSKLKRYPELLKDSEIQEALQTTAQPEAPGGPTVAPQVPAPKAAPKPVPVAAAPKPMKGDYEILSADYGSAQKHNDVTEVLKKQSQEKSFKFKGGNNSFNKLFSDPDKNVVKELEITYKLPNGEIKTVKIKEDQAFTLP